jgi:cytochrome P450
VLPSVLARKGLAGRAKVVKAFEDYFQSEGHEKASILMRNRYDTSVRNGVSLKDIARYEVGGSLAVLVNTAPAAFWMLLYVCSYPDTLNDIRKEVGSILTTSIDEKGVKINSLDITSVKNSCPFLTSTFQEVLRHRSMGTSVRLVMQDTVLDGQWLLKKDCLIQMPSRVIHKDASVWGNDVNEFNPRRFMKNEKHQTANGKRPQAAAFRAFGGGTTLCPGRHFATNEILALVSMLVIRYDIAPTSGTWSMPETNNTNVAAVIMEPDTDVEVEISQRHGFEDGRWIFSLKDSEKIFSIVAEDQVVD